MRGSLPASAFGTAAPQDPHRVTQPWIAQERASGATAGGIPRLPGQDAVLRSGHWTRLHSGRPGAQPRIAPDPPRRAESAPPARRGRDCAHPRVGRDPPCRCRMAPPQTRLRSREWRARSSAYAMKGPFRTSLDSGAGFRTPTAHRRPDAHQGCHFGNSSVKASRKPQPSGPPSGLSAQYRAPAWICAGCLPSLIICATIRLIGTDHSSVSQL